MRSILDVIKAASLQIGLDVPTGVVGSSVREHQELTEIANLAAAEIGRASDWQGLRRIHTMTGDGVKRNFPLPLDYDRLTVNSQLYSSDLHASYQQVIDPNQWLRYITYNTGFNYVSWALYGDEMQFLPAPAANEEIKFFYLTRNTILSDTNIPQERFLKDSDRFRLNDDVLEYGIVYLWKKQKGFDWSGAYDEYTARLNEKIGTDQTRPMITIGNPYPWVSHNTYPANVIP